jgi:hypothetical protein
VRDPLNAADSNAIAVLDSLGRRAGWIPRKKAKSLAVGLDLGTIVILECIVESEETIRVHYKLKK